MQVGDLIKEPVIRPVIKKHSKVPQVFKLVKLVIQITGQNLDHRRLEKIVLQYLFETDLAHTRSLKKFVLVKIDLLVQCLL